MLGSEARDNNKAWLMQQVNHVLEPLMLEIVKEKPDNTVSSKRPQLPFQLLKLILILNMQIQYMVEYLEREFGDRALNGDMDQTA